jgi:putative N6-adenine-specific DNA methylase
VALDIGGGARHRRGERVAMVEAPMRETLAAQLVMFSRWDARSEPLVDLMTGGGTIAVEAAHLAVGRAVRLPAELPFRRLAAFDGLPTEAPDLFPGTVPRIVAADADAQAIKALVGNLRASGLTGPAIERSFALRQMDARDANPRDIEPLLPGVSMETGVLVMNPPYGQRLESGDDDALMRLYFDLGRACSRFTGWRVAVFVAHDGFRHAFGEGYGRDARIIKPASNAALRGWFLLF